MPRGPDEHSRNFCRCRGTCSPFRRQPDDRLSEDTCQEHVRICLAIQRRSRSWRTSAMSRTDQAGCLQGIRYYKVLSSAADTRVAQPSAPASTTRDNFHNLHRLLIYTANSGKTWNVPRALEIIALAHYNRIVVHHVTTRR